jgi:hypothetical protein
MASQSIGDLLRLAAADRWLCPEEIYTILSGDPVDQFGFSLTCTVQRSPQGKNVSHI